MWTFVLVIESDLVVNPNPELIDAVLIERRPSFF